MGFDRASGDLGSRLRAARERRGLSLRQIASATKISVAALEALERNDLAKLPGGIFSRAFVRSYASEVGLDPDEAVEDFLAQYPHAPNVVPHTHAQAHVHADESEDHDAVESERQAASTFLRLAAISVPLAIAVVYFGVVGTTPTSSPPVPEPAPRAVADTVPSAATPPPAAPAVDLPKTPPASAKPTGTTARVSTPPSAADNAPRVQAPRAAAPVVAAAEAKPADVSRLTIELRVTRPCWVSATADGAKKIERLLQPGQRETIDIARELSITAADASAVKMTINGADARPLGKEGEVVTARVNMTNFRSYLSAR